MNISKKIKDALKNPIPKKKDILKKQIKDEQINTKRNY